MKTPTMNEFYEILDANGMTVEEFCKEIEISPQSFQVLTVSTKKPPRWIKSFLIANSFKK